MINKGQFQHVTSAFAIVGLLKACATHRDLSGGSKLHLYIREHTILEKNPYIASTLVNMYAKCGAFAKAQQVLEGLSVRDLFAWSALIAGHAQLGQGDEALKCYDNMQREGHCPDAVTYTCALKACGSIGAAAKGEEIHVKVASLGLLEKDLMLGSTLVDMYARCGALARAQEVLEALPVRNVVTWNALIAGYAQQGKGLEAVKCFDSMQSEGHRPNEITFNCALKACGITAAAVKGEQFHDKIVNLGMLEKNMMLGNTLVDMYAKCGELIKAHQVLEDLSLRDVATWNALIAGYSQQGQGEEALNCFDSMQREGHFPDAITFTCALKACGSIGAVAKGEELHDMIARLGMLEKNIVLGCSLVDMYVRCAALGKAHQVLEGLSVRNVVTWNALISGYTEQGQGEEALKCFDSMQCDGHSPDAATFSCALKACGNIGAAAKGRQIHGKIVSLGMLEKNLELGNTLVNMYSKCSVLAMAKIVLEVLPVRNTMTWNALVAGYVLRGQGEDALKCFDSMQHEGHSPDVVSFIGAMKACGTIGAAAKGAQIHDKVVSLGMLEKNNELRNILVDMYVKCGSLMRALEVFKELPLRNMVTWNALIAGYSHRGQCLEALDCFEKMQCDGMMPDSVTLTCVLNACSHSGLLDEAKMFFSRISTKYGIIPNVEHYCCMVDVFGRARKFNDALMMIEKMPCVEYLSLWVSLLGACHKWGELVIGRLAFDHLICLETSNAAVYVSMLDISIAAGMQENADKIEGYIKHWKCLDVVGQLI